MPGDDLLEHAKSDRDFYELIGGGIHPGSTEKAISSAYRRTALKHHPDKNQDDPDAVTKFHTLQIAYDVLSDPAAKAAYDNARAAREARKRQNEMFEGKRKAMKEDLERRESAALKRKRGEMDAEDRLEMEIRRLAEDGRRRRMERMEALRKEQDEDAKEQENQVEQPAARVNTGGTNVPEEQRTVKVRWLREGVGETIDKERLSKMFGKFGRIETTVLLKDRKMRLGDDRKKRMVGTGIVVFSSVVGAHAAVEDAKKQEGEEWKVLESIEWAQGKEPDFLARFSSSASAPSQTEQPSTPAQPSPKPRSAFSGLNSAPTTPLSAFKANASTANGTRGDGLRKVPSFASFTSANFNSPSGSPFGKGPQSPSLEEITMIRLKNAEKNRREKTRLEEEEKRHLEEQIRREEAEEAANREMETT